ncbi:hypothetical protein ACHAWF_002326 [Thalassiosira exigua]
MASPAADAVASYPPILRSLAAWAWSSDPSPAVTPSACLASLPFLTALCFSRLLARCVGIGIVLLSCANRAPVIRNLLTSKSAVGMSVGGTYGEVIMYSNAALYNFLRGNPFTAYGETVSVLLQVLVVVALIWRYDIKMKAGDAAMAVAGYAIYLFVVFRCLMLRTKRPFTVLTPDTHYVLMVCNPLVLIYSRGAQIRENYANKQTGAQSVVTTSMNLAGSLVRMVTTIKEVGYDFHILRSYGASAFLNSVLLGQILAYKSNTEKFRRSLEGKKKE